jgi:hypothetical protein
MFNRLLTEAFLSFLKKRTLLKDKDTNKTRSETLSYESTENSESEEFYKFIAMKLLEKNYMKDIYNSAILKLLDRKTNYEILQKINLEKITNYFNRERKFSKIENMSNDHNQNLIKTSVPQQGRFLNKKRERIVVKRSLKPLKNYVY